MFTNNYYWYKYYIEYLYDQRYPTESDFDLSVPKLVKRDGTAYSAPFRISSNYNSTGSQVAYRNTRLWYIGTDPGTETADMTSETCSYTFAKAGTSDTPEDRTDYNLKAVNNNLSCIINSHVKGYIDDDFTFIRTLTITVKNNSNEELIVKEIGLFKNIGYYTAWQAWTSGAFMFVRQVLQNPVTLQAGQQAQVVLQLKETLKPQ